MAYPDKTLWGDMHQESPDEFLTGDGKLLPLPLVLIVPDSKCDRGFRHGFNTVIADGNPVGILTKIADYRFSATEWLLAVSNPVLFITGIQ